MLYVIIKEKTKLVYMKFFIIKWYGVILYIPWIEKKYLFKDANILLINL